MAIGLASDVSSIARRRGSVTSAFNRHKHQLMLSVNIVGQYQITAITSAQHLGLFFDINTPRQMSRQIDGSFVVGVVYYRLCYCLQCFSAVGC